MRKLAKLTIEEELSFEEKLGTNTAKKIVDFRVVSIFLPCRSITLIKELMCQVWWVWPCTCLFSFHIQCPGCSTFVERMDVSNLCVQCPVCTERTENSYEFCWNCLGGWKGSHNRADRCGNAGCTIDKKLLEDCAIISLTYFENEAQCPKIRACTSCGVLIEHTNDGCNNMECPECDYEFCFICLNPGHDYYKHQPCKMAPRQIESESQQ